MQTQPFPGLFRSLRSGGLILLTTLMLAGCAGPNLEDYQGQAPELVPSCQQHACGFVVA